MPEIRIWIILVAGLFLISLLSCSSGGTDSGHQLYVQNCESCHMQDGSGLRQLIPPLAQSDYLIKNRRKLPCLIKHGIQGPIIVNGQEYQQIMPGAETLTADQITNLLNYVQTNFGNKNERFTIPEVAAILDTCSHNH